MKSLDRHSSPKAKPTFNELVKKMPELLQELKAGDLLTKENLKRIPQPQKGVGVGLYVFYEKYKKKDKPLYVGRSNRLRERLHDHSQERAKPNTAPFAFILTKEKLGFPPDTKRKQVVKHKKFENTFRDELKRVRKMKIRVVQIADDEDQLKQALFEIYAAVTLKTKYNSFRTS